jgi:dihydrofolate reductase
VRTVVFGGASTLDNYFARKDGAVDWIKWSDEAAAVMAEYSARFDAMVMGRRTYEVMLRFGDQGGSGNLKTYVFSKTLSPEAYPKATIVSSNPGSFVRDLKSEPGKDICVMGGAELGHALLEADVVDEIGFTIHPVLLGDGIPLFRPMSRQIDLELLQSRPFANGCVLAIYRVKR